MRGRQVLGYGLGAPGGGARQGIEDEEGERPGGQEEVAGAVAGGGAVVYPRGSMVEAGVVGVLPCRRRSGGVRAAQMGRRAQVSTPGRVAGKEGGKRVWWFTGGVNR